MTALLFIIGLISILGQVVLLRELNVASFGVELVYILALGFWLAATALGALSCRSASMKRPGLLTSPLLFFAALLPLAVAFARGSRVVAGGVPGAYLPLGEQIVTIGITLLPAGFVTGWLFRRAAGLFVSEGRTVAAAYAIESAGGLAGGLLSSLGLHWGVQNFALALIGALIAAAAPLLITAGAKRSRSKLPAVTLCTVLLLCLYQAPALDGGMTRWNHPSLLESRDTPYGRISITQREQQVSVFVNNALAFETEGTEAEHFAHLAALQHPQPERILILGGGIEGTVAEVLEARTYCRRLCRSRPRHDRHRQGASLPAEAGAARQARREDHHGRPPEVSAGGGPVRPHPHRHARALVGTGQPVLHAGVLPAVP